MYKADNQGGATIRAPHSAARQIFKSPILSRLPKLSDSPDRCFNCQKHSPRFDDMPIKHSKLCRECVGVWQRLDAIINDYADRKAIEHRAAKLAAWTEKIGGAKHK